MSDFPVWWIAHGDYLGARSPAGSKRSSDAAKRNPSFRLRNCPASANCATALLRIGPAPAGSFQEPSTTDGRYLACQSPSRDFSSDRGAMDTADFFVNETKVLRRSKSGAPMAELGPLPTDWARWIHVCFGANRDRQSAGRIARRRIR